jgi:hypothetical protein
MAIWSISRSIGILCSHLVFLLSFGIFSPFLVCCTYKEKSGNPAWNTCCTQAGPLRGRKWNSPISETAQGCQILVHFHTKNINLGIGILEGLEVILVGIFKEYFTAIRYILCTFDIFLVIWYYFSPFWYIVPRQIWQP